MASGSLVKCAAVNTNKGLFLQKHANASCQHFYLTYFSLHMALASSGHSLSWHRATTLTPVGLLLKEWKKTLLWPLWSVFSISKGSRLFLDSALPKSALCKEELTHQMHQRCMVLHRKVSAAARPRMWTCAMFWPYGLRLLCKKYDWSVPHTGTEYGTDSSIPVRFEH